MVSYTMLTCTFTQNIGMLEVFNARGCRDFITSLYSNDDGYNSERHAIDENNSGNSLTEVQSMQC